MENNTKETAPVKRLRTNVINILRYGLNHDCWDERNYLRISSRPMMKTKSEVKRLIESGRLKMRCTRTFLDNRHVKGCGKKSFKEISEWCGAHIVTVEEVLNNIASSVDQVSDGLVEPHESLNYIQHQLDLLKR